MGLYGQGLLRTGGGKQVDGSTGDRLVCTMYRCTLVNMVHCTPCGTSSSIKRTATAISHLSLPHPNLFQQFHEFHNGKCAIIHRTASRGTGVLVYVGEFAPLDISQGCAVRADVNRTIVRTVRYSSLQEWEARREWGLYSVLRPRNTNNSST